MPGANFTDVSVSKQQYSHSTKITLGSVFEHDDFNRECGTYNEEDQ